MNTILLKSVLLATLGSFLCPPAQAIGTSPVPGSSRPDAWGRPGGQVSLTVPEVLGRTVNVAGTPATVAGQQVSLTLPVGTPPGRLLIRFADQSGAQTLATREIEVLPDTAAQSDVLPGQLQLLLNPRLTPLQVQALLAGIDPRLGRVVGTEVLPAPKTAPAARAVSPSPCSGTLAQLQLSAGVTLEQALNSLLATAGTDVWYPDPITIWRAPATAPATAPGSQPSFNYVPSPVSPRAALGMAGRPTTLTGQGVTIAVLDTGYSPALDPLNELTGRVSAPLNALIPYDPLLSLQGTADFWEGHGTQVAIMAAGRLNGVATRAQVQPVKVCAPGTNGRAACNTRDVLRGLCETLAVVPADRLVFNLSLGGSTPTSGIHAVLNWASGQGAVVVAAGGNGHGRGDPKEYPAAFASGTPGQVSLPLLAVASVSPAGGALWQYSPFSTLGGYLNISAPGEALDIGHAHLYSGTSFAAPLVAGAAALVRQASASVSPAVVRQFMLQPARVQNFPGVQPMLSLRTY